MSEPDAVSSAQFTDRFTSIVLRGRGFPKSTVDRHILLYSATLALNPEQPYAEPELNDLLCQWTARFGESLELDHVTLRRYLIDEGYIRRNPAGTTYLLETEKLPCQFDPAIATFDLDELVAKAVEERALRKQRYLGQDS